MSNIKNFVDEKTTKKIIDAMRVLGFYGIHKLAEDSNIPAEHLFNIIDRTEEVTQLDKGKLIIHLVNIMEMTEQEKQEIEDEEINYTSLKDFQRHKTG